MKITGVTIENWRNIHRLELAFGPHITVVHGPNEVGKSTVQEAIRHAMLVDASSSARELHELVPWGSSAKAHVELTLETGRGDRLRIVKSFPRGEARLFLERSAAHAPAPTAGARPDSEVAPAEVAPAEGDRGGDDRAGGQPRESLLAEGRAVQEKVFEYLDVPAEAADLFDLLWIGQGTSLGLFSAKPELGPIDAAAQSFVKTIIKENLLSGRAEQFYRELKEEWDSLLQKNGRPRKGSRLADLERREGELQQEAASADSQLAEVEAMAVELASIEARIDGLESAREAAQRRFTLLEEKQEASTALQPRIAALARLEEAQRRLIALEAREREVADSLPGLWRRKSDALIAWIATLEQRRGRAEELRTLLERMEAELSSAKVTERRLLEELEGGARLVREARLRLEASGLSVSARRTGEGQSSLMVSIDDAAPKEFSLGEVLRWDAARTLRLSVDSRLEIDCSGPLSRDEWEKLMGEIEREEEGLKERLGAIGLDTVEQAKEAYDRFVQDTGRRSRLEGELASLLGPGGDGLARELAEVERAKDELSKEGGRLAGLGIGGALTENREQAKGAPPVSTAPLAPEEAAGSTPAGRGEGHSTPGPPELARALSGQLSIGIREVEEGRRQRSELLGERTREEFTHELYSLKEELDHAQKTVSSMEPVEVETVTPAGVKQQRGELDRLQGELLEAVERRSSLGGQLQSVGGLAERSERTHRALASVQRDLAAERTRVGGLSLLIRLIEEEKEELDRNIVAPLQERLTDAFRSVVGERYAEVRITDALGIGGVAAAAFDRPVEVLTGALSFGTREQLSFLFRLLVAQYLSTREPQVMLLDDTFVNSDARRRDRMFEMMMNDDGGVQFILFTCHGDHYEGYRGRAEVAMISLPHVSE